MDDLISIYNKTVKSYPKKYNPKAQSRITPSMLGSDCARKVYYHYSRSPEETGMPIKVDRILKLGTAIGDVLIETYRKAKVVVDYRKPDGSIAKMFGKDTLEFPVSSPNLGIISGYIDMVYILDGKLHLAEFKSINDDGYIKLNKPINKHVVQSVIYLYLFNKHLQHGDYKHIKELTGFKKAEEIKLLYYNKNSSYLKVHKVDASEENFKKLIQKILLIRLVSNTKILPPKTFEYCNTCAYKARCENNQLAPKDGGKL